MKSLMLPAANIITSTAISIAAIMTATFHHTHCSDD